MQRRNRGNRGNKKKKKHQDQQQEQQAPQVRHDNEDGEELGHESKHATSASVVKPAARPAVEYTYSSDDIRLLTKALDGANHAFHYLSKELTHHSHILGLIQALHTTDNCFRKMIQNNIDEELRSKIAFKGGGNKCVYIADRLVAAHAGSIRSLLSSMQCDLEYLRDWCVGFRELAIDRIVWGRFKEIESTVPVKEQASAKAEVSSALMSVPKIVDDEPFDLPLQDPQVCFNDQFARPLANIWEALNIIRHISLNVLQQPLTQPRMGTIASAIMVVVENLKKLPQDHTFREGRSFKELKDLRNELAHSTDNLQRLPGYIFSRYIKPFLKFRGLIEPTIKNMPVIELDNIGVVVEEHVQEGDGSAPQDVELSYRKAHTELFDKLTKLNLIKPGRCKPDYQENGRVFNDEELLRIAFLLPIHEQRSFSKNLALYTPLKAKSFINMPLLVSFVYSKDDTGLTLVEYISEEHPYLKQAGSQETINHYNVIYPSYRNTYLLEFVIKGALNRDGPVDNTYISFTRELLLEYKANPNIDIFYPGNDGAIRPLISCLVHYKNTELLQLVLERGVNANLKGAQLFVGSLLEGKTEEFLKFLIEHGVDPLNEWSIGERAVNSICNLGINMLEDESACKMLLIAIRVLIPVYGITAIQNLFRSTFSPGEDQKYLFVDYLNLASQEAGRAKFAQLVNILMELTSYNEELVHSILANDLRAIRNAFEKSQGSDLQSLMNMKLHPIKSTTLIDVVSCPVNNKLQDEVVRRCRSRLKLLKQGFKQELMLENYHAHHKGFNRAGTLRILLLEHKLEEVGFSDFVKLFCDANVAEQVIAWSKHGVGKVEASTPALELKDDDDGVEVPAVATNVKAAPVLVGPKMTPIQAEAKATRLMDEYIAEAIAKIETARFAVNDGGGAKAPAAATKVISIEERAAEEVESILTAAAEIIVADRASTAANNGASFASAQTLATPRIMSQPTSAPTQYPTMSYSGMPEYSSGSAAVVITNKGTEVGSLQSSTDADSQKLPESGAARKHISAGDVLYSVNTGLTTLKFGAQLANAKCNPTESNIASACFSGVHLQGMLLRSNSLSQGVTVASIVYHGTQGDWQAVTTTTGYMILSLGLFKSYPSIWLAFNAFMVVQSVPSTFATAYDAYHTYGPYQGCKYGTVEDKVQALTAYKDLYATLKLETKPLEQEINSLNLGLEKDATAQRLFEEHGEFAQKLYDHIYEQLLEEEYILLNDVLEEDLTMEAAARIMDTKQLTNQYGYEHCIQTSRFESHNHYYCYNNGLPVIDHIVVVGNEAQVVERL